MVKLVMTICTHPTCTQNAIAAGKCQIHRYVKLCTHPGCNHRRTLGEKCRIHGGVRTSCTYLNCTEKAMYVGRCEIHKYFYICTHPECDKERRIDGKCRKHGGVRTSCSYLNCTEKAITNGRCEIHKYFYVCTYPDCTQPRRVGERCAKHGGGHLCNEEGCDKASRDGPNGYCIKHGGSKHKLCIHPGCDKQEFKDHKCKKHGDGFRYECTYEGCHQVRQAGGLCIKHGGGRRCYTPLCIHQAVYPTYHCRAHGGGKRCVNVGCPHSAPSGTDYCVGCGGGKRCITPGCPYGVKGSDEKCGSCGQGIRCACCNNVCVAKLGLNCSACRNGCAPETKEQKVVDYLNLHVHRLMTSHNKELRNIPERVRYRPDILYDMTLFVLIVEVDENQHTEKRRYTPAGEKLRMEQTQLAVNRPTIFIRYNPDPFKINGKTSIVRQDTRLGALAECVKRKLYGGVPLVPLTIEYMFYDETIINPEETNKIDTTLEQNMETKENLQNIDDGKNDKRAPSFLDSDLPMAKRARSTLETDDTKEKSLPTTDSIPFKSASQQRASRKSLRAAKEAAAKQRLRAWVAATLFEHIPSAAAYLFKDIPAPSVTSLVPPRPFRFVPSMSCPPPFHFRPNSKR